MDFAFLDVESSTNIIVKNITMKATSFGSIRALNILSSSLLDIDSFSIQNSIVEQNNLLYISETKDLNFTALDIRNIKKSL